MTGASRRRQRARGGIDELPSGSLRVSVYAGIDPVTKRRHYLREVVPPGPTAWADAEKAVRRLANQVDERQHPKTSATVNQLLDQHFELLTLERSTMDTYVRYADKHIRPFIGRAPVGSLDAGVFDSLYAELRRCRDHCDRSAHIEHRTERAHKCDPRCRPHVCTPLSASTIRQVHFVLSGALKRAVRWRWLATNPITEAEPPPAPRPSPRPPSAQEAARILAEAWKDPDWGLLVWVAMVTGLRRGELCGIRWRHVDLDTGVLALERSIGQRSGQTWEKDTKTHQQRRIALDPETIELLTEYRDRCANRAGELGLELAQDGFLFSLAPDGSTHLLPDSVSQRYGKLAKRLGIHTSIHKLRHYSATELIAAGVDVRTVAGRLGHAGGGTTTLRVYAAWVSESDQRAATSLFSRMPSRPLESRSPLREPRYPYEKLAAAILDEIAAGRFEVGAFLPGQKVLAAERGVAVGTAHRAMDLLREEGFVEVRPGHGFRVVARPGAANPIRGAQLLLPVPPARSAEVATNASGRRLLNLELRLGATMLSRFMAEANPTDAGELRGLLADAVRRVAGDADISLYELDLCDASGLPIETFVATRFA